MFRSTRQGLNVLLGIRVLVVGAAEIAGWTCAHVALAQSPSITYDKAEKLVRSFDSRPLSMAIGDLTETFGSRYADGPRYLARLEHLERSRTDLVARLNARDETTRRAVVALAGRLVKLRSEALLANPLLDLDRLLLVRRAHKNPDTRGRRRAYRRFPYGKSIGLPVNHYSTFSVEQTGYDNEIAVLSPVRPSGKLTTLFRPPDDRFVGNVDLHFDADRLLLTMPQDGRWQVFEIRADGAGLRRVSPDDQPDVDNYDACYLPNGRIIFCSTASYQAVPCWNGLHNVAGLYVMDPDGENVRQLTFDQDDNCCPTVLNTGQVLYNRWEYTNISHIFAHLLFEMNPDGTGQRCYYGSNSYWPNAVYFARPIPGHPTRIVGIVSGHHGDHRVGELVIFDVAWGRHAADGVVQRIPGYGKAVEPIIRDALVNDSWPKFVHPVALNGKYFLVSAKPAPESQWSIYLVDVFDNMLLIHEEPGYALLEPVPFRRTPRPPVVAERVDLGRTDGVVYLQDVYAGPGLTGVPRGTVKALRVYSYHFGYRGLTGWSKIGIDGPWDVMRILGTTEIESDGSALFRVPANTPIAVEPLDADGRALQVMRSWFTVMPGEVRSCVGCHEHPNTTPLGSASSGATRNPAELRPWYGPARGFDFEREVQPVLDKYCVDCHNGKPQLQGRTIPDLRASVHVAHYRGRLVNVPAWWSQRHQPPYSAELMRSRRRKTITMRYTPAYEALHPYVRRPGLESDYQLSVPAEYHANTSELIQMLAKGHHNIRMDEESWDRLVTWIDLNVPCHGTWGDALPIPFDGARRRRELLKRYANVDEDPEAIPQVARRPVKPVMPEPFPPADSAPKCPGWPCEPGEAKRRQTAAGPRTRRTIHLADGVDMAMVLIPPGGFVMGDPRGEADERPATRVRIDRPFWMSCCEVTNRQYALFDPEHDSRYINQLNTNMEVRGYPVNQPNQPVVRISWDRAMAFCRWLSDRTGEHSTLPSEAQWEYACRAGTATLLCYGDVDTDFARYGNMADATLTRFAEDARNRGTLYKMQPDWMLKVASVDDGALVTTRVGRYLPNAWGLSDMHGNACEWTRTAYRPYPYRPDDGRDEPSADGQKVVRGGSWYDRPKRCRSAFRLSYPAWQRVYNVGFRVICTTQRASAVEEQRID